MKLAEYNISAVLTVSLPLGTRTILNSIKWPSQFAPHMNNYNKLKTIKILAFLFLFHFSALDIDTLNSQVLFWDSFRVSIINY